MEKAETAARCGVKVPVLEGAWLKTIPEFNLRHPSTARAPRAKPHRGLVAPVGVVPDALILPDGKLEDPGRQVARAALPGP